MSYRPAVQGRSRGVDVRVQFFSSAIRQNAHEQDYPAVRAGERTGRRGRCGAGGDDTLRGGSARPYCTSLSGRPFRTRIHTMRLRQVVLFRKIIQRGVDTRYWRVVAVPQGDSLIRQFNDDRYAGRLSPEILRQKEPEPEHRRSGAKASCRQKHHRQSFGNRKKIFARRIRKWSETGRAGRKSHDRHHGQTGAGGHNWSRRVKKYQKIIKNIPSSS